MTDKPRSFRSRPGSPAVWFMNHIANPVVGLILRSPLHGMLSADVLLIRYRGRKSGATYTLPVQYVQSGNAIYILPGSPEHKTWWRNLKGDAPVEILLRRQRLRAEAGLLVGQADLELLCEALALYLQGFPGLIRSYGVHRKPDGSFDAAELRKAAASLVMVRVRPLEASSPGPGARK
ncbi:MAG: nitroreductase/quinone reductase family protein [Anaerolineales bacterium]